MNVNIIISMETLMTIMMTKPMLILKLAMQDFCWAEQGFSVMSPFYSELALLLDDKFRAATKIVRTQFIQDLLNPAIVKMLDFLDVFLLFQFANKDAKTSREAEAVWSYVQVKYNLVKS